MHTLLYSRDAEATRSFLRDALGLASVDAGRGWLIFALPPAEVAVHPADEPAGPELYLMCDDVERSIDQLTAAGAEVTQALSDQRWGRVATLRIPGDVRIGIYEPRHPTALALAVAQISEARNRAP